MKTTHLFDVVDVGVVEEAGDGIPFEVEDREAVEHLVEDFSHLRPLVRVEVGVDEATGLDILVQDDDVGIWHLVSALHPAKLAVVSKVPLTRRRRDDDGQRQGQKADGEFHDVDDKSSFFDAARRFRIAGFRFL